MKVDEENLRKSEEVMQIYEESYEKKLRKIWGKVRKVMKLDEENLRNVMKMGKENLRKSEESYEDRWENFRKSKDCYEDRWGKL